MHKCRGPIRCHKPATVLFSLEQLKQLVGWYQEVRQAQIPHTGKGQPQQLPFLARNQL